MRIHDDDMPTYVDLDLSPEDVAELEQRAAEEGVSPQVMLSRRLMSVLVADGVLTEEEAQEVVELNEFLHPHRRPR